MNLILEHALSLILDDETCAQYTDHRTVEILGREHNADHESDARWWNAKTAAVNELLAAAISLNTTD